MWRLRSNPAQAGRLCRQAQRCAEWPPRSGGSGARSVRPGRKVRPARLWRGGGLWPPASLWGIERGPEDPREDRPRPGPWRSLGRSESSRSAPGVLCGQLPRVWRCLRALGAERKRGEREGRRGPRPPEARGGSGTEAVPARPARRPGPPASAKVRKPRVSARRQQPTQKIIHKIMLAFEASMSRS